MLVCIVFRMCIHSIWLTYVELFGCSGFELQTFVGMLSGHATWEFPKISVPFWGTFSLFIQLIAFRSIQANHLLLKAPFSCSFFHA